MLRVSHSVGDAVKKSRALGDWRVGGMNRALMCLSVRAAKLEQLMKQPVRYKKLTKEVVGE